MLQAGEARLGEKARGGCGGWQERAKARPLRRLVAGKGEREARLEVGENWQVGPGC
jgi:hypothetical protein